MRTLGRNDRCWCDSGKKYKKCHMAADELKASQGGASSAVLPPPVRRKKPRRPARKLLLNQEQREGMRAAGRFNAQVLDHIRDLIVPGAVLEDIDKVVDEYTRDHGNIPACVGYKGYPKAICTSVNDVICHGIPDSYALREGDIVNFDLTSIVDGWHGDQSETFLIGDVSDEARRVTQCSFDCLYLGIEAIGPGSKVMDIGFAIQQHAHAQGFSVVEAFQGHGIGRVFHQEPGVSHYPDPVHGDYVLEPGLCFTIEPMINVGDKEHTIDRDDGWTARTIDGKLSAQFEHTLLMTETGIEILTQTERGPRPGFKF